MPVRGARQTEGGLLSDPTSQVRRVSAEKSKGREK
jgi:hypothetical protein